MPWTPAPPKGGRGRGPGPAREGRAGKCCHPLPGRPRHRVSHDSAETLVAQRVPLVPRSSLDHNSWLTFVPCRRLDSQAMVPTLSPVAHPSPWPEARTGSSGQPRPRALGYGHLGVTSGAEDGPPGAWPEAASALSVSNLEPGVGQGPGAVHVGGVGSGMEDCRGPASGLGRMGAPAKPPRGPSSCSLVPGLLRPPGSKLPTLWVRGFHDERWRALSPLRAPSQNQATGSHLLGVAHCALVAGNRHGPAAGNTAVLESSPEASVGAEQGDLVPGASKFRRQSAPLEKAMRALGRDPLLCAMGHGG